MANATIYSYEIVIRQNEKLLEKMYQNKVYQTKGVPTDVLKGEGIELSLFCNIEVNNATGGAIFWFGCYGVEPTSAKATHYTLHARSKEKVPQYLKGRAHV